MGIRVAPGVKTLRMRVDLRSCTYPTAVGQDPTRSLPEQSFGEFRPIDVGDHLLQQVSVNTIRLFGDIALEFMVELQDELPGGD